MSLDRYEPPANADVSAAIPTELVNFHRLSVGDPAIPGKDAWHLFFEYIDDEPAIVGIWREGDYNLESLRGDASPDL